MPKYTYVAKSAPYQFFQGEIEAETEQDAVNKLTKMGYFPISVKSEIISLEERSLLGLRKISHKDIVQFTRQLSNLIESGVNIINGLNIIMRQNPNKYLKAILNDVISKIKDGRSLADSLASHPYLFSNLYTSIMRSGEAGGTMNETLKSLAEFLEKEDDFKDSLRAALTYPLFIFIVGILTVVILLGFVIPRLVVMFEDMGQVLPLPTRIMIGISDVLHNYRWFILAIIFIFVFLWQRLYRKPQGKVLWDRFKLKLAVLGQVILKTEISRLMRTLSLLLASGLPIMPALEISASVVENNILKSELLKFKGEIAAGASLSDCLKTSKIFPELVTNIVAIGEETGSLEKSLMRIANEYEKEVDRTLKTLTRLIEPIVILAMGLIVGFIIISMLLPIFQINLMVR